MLHLALALLPREVCQRYPTKNTEDADVMVEGLNLAIRLKFVIWA